MNVRRTGLVSLALVLSLSACGLGGGDKKADPKPTDSSSPVVDDNGMTVWGTALTFGEPARVVWSPKANKQGSVEVTVDSVEQVKIGAFAGFKMTDDLLKSTPYYVRVTATNIGETKLGGAQLPLFLDNGSDVLYPPANITSAFKACPNRLLPETFDVDATAELCLVFLAGAGTSLRAVALQTPESVDQIEWTGEVITPKKAKKLAKQAEKDEKAKKKGKSAPRTDATPDAPTDDATD